MAINLASKFSKYVDEAFAHESLLRGATSDKVEFTGVNEVSVYSVDKMEMNDYVMEGTSRYGTVKEIGDRVQTFRIDRDRSFTGSIDEGNAQDQYNVKDASARLHVQIRDVVIPETEAYVMMKWAYGAGKVVGGAAPTSETLLGLIQAGASHMNNNHVPRAGRSMFIAETYAAMLPNLANLTYLERLGSQALTENKLPRVAGFDVHVVPDGDIPEGVYFILQHKDACPFAQKLTKYKIQKDPMGIDGNVIEGRVRYWAGVLGEKCNAVYVYAASASVQAVPTFGGTGTGTTLTAAGATIYATLDGSDPRYSKSRILVASGGTVAGAQAGQTIRAYAYSDTKYPSAVVEKAIS